MNRYIRLILKNSLRNRRRSALTIASIAVSLCLLGVLLALYRGLFFGGETTPGQALRLITHHKVSLAQDLPLSYEEKIEQTPGVKAVTRLRWFGSTYKDAGDPENRFARFAIEPLQFFEVHPEFDMPDDQKQAFRQEKTSCIASKSLADKLGWKLGERIVLVGDTSPVTLDLTLVGSFDDPDHSENLFFNSDYLRDSLPASDIRRDMVQQFHIQAASKEDVTRVASAIDAMFENSPAPTTTESERAFMLSFVAFIGNVRLFLAAVCGAVTFTILLVSANTISMSVRERTREVGVLKTLGFASSEILGLIVGEATAIAFSGGVVGCLLAAGLCAGLTAAMPNGPGFIQLGMTPLIASVNLALALLIGVVSALVPAVGAARTSIIDSLRYTG
jgi:putative ABC transport system permease protein